MRGWRSEQRGRYFAPRCEADRLVFTLPGPGRTPARRARSTFATPPTALDGEAARWQLHARAGAPGQLEWEVERGRGRAIRGRRAAPSFDAQRGTLDAALPRLAQAAAPAGRTEPRRFDALLDRAADDLRALYVEVDGARVISAGIPWYSTVFGRDSIITSLQTLPAPTGHRARDAALSRPASGRARGPVHARSSPARSSTSCAAARWRGAARSRTCRTTAASTPRRSGWCCCTRPGAGPATTRWSASCCPTRSARSTWIDRFGDLDGDGFVEYARTSAKGLVNQGWKDSGDGVPFPDGRLPAPPIALVEVQGYVYDAKVRMAELYQAAGQPERAAALRRRGGRAAGRGFAPRSGSRSSGTFALALDGAKRPLPHRHHQRRPPALEPGADAGPGAQRVARRASRARLLLAAGASAR